MKVQRHCLLAALILPPDILRPGSRRYLPASGQADDGQEAEWDDGGGRAGYSRSCRVLE